MKTNRFGYVTLVGALLGLLALLLAPRPAAAQVIEYYHLDAIGNVRAITDQSGNVIERHDYLPFGEECAAPPCTPLQGDNTKKFTGKERDQETGLDFFGARYYGSKIGRFTTVDPAMTLQANLVDPQRWNRYAYGLNNPFRYIDPDGRWPTKLGYTVHQESIGRVLGFLPASDREILAGRQVEMDDDQSSSGAFKHAMRAHGKNGASDQTVEEATAQANQFVRSELDLARALEAAGAHLSAMDHLGNAMHTLQDATSPAHEGFQVWDEKWDRVLSREGQAHVKKELFYPPKGSALDQATGRAYEYFSGKREMPTNFFAHDDK